MKKIILALILGIGFIASVKMDKDTQYAKVAEVTEIDLESDTVTFTDLNGNDWIFEGVEDWMIGDTAGLIMDNNETVSIYDDIIISATYQG